MSKGGARIGAGRKSIAEEEKTKELCKAAIKGKFGTVEEGLKWLLESGEANLVKFVFEHALGKPTEKVESTVDVEMIVSFKDAE